MTDTDPKRSVGAMQLYDYYKPALEAGTYRIEVQQVLTVKDEVHALPDGPAYPDNRATQEFTVLAPQFGLDSAQITNRYPPSGSTGAYGEVLPHIVLKDPMLAWERQMGPAGAALPIPWVALLVFEENELEPGDNPDTNTTTTSVKAFLALDAGVGTPSRVLVPTLTPGADVVLSAGPDPHQEGAPLLTSCQYIKLKVDVFRQVVPHLDELRYLSHVREVDTSSRPLAGVSESGLFAVTMANRFPRVPAELTGPPCKNIVHLVSLEGLEHCLTAAPDLGDYAQVALVSLASWSFLAQHDPLQDFKKLAENLVLDASDQARWLRLWPLPPGLSPDTDANDREVAQRLRLGYAPLAYHTRSGENTFAWYRGPLVPQPTSPKNLGPFFTADAALVYDAGFDVFDASVAAAWELGREAALADASFGPTLLHFRRKASQLIDKLSQPAAYSGSASTAAGAFRDLLATDKLKVADIGAVGPKAGDDATAVATRAATQAASIRVAAAAPVPQTSDKLEAQYSAAALGQLQVLLADDLATLAGWLGKLLLLHLVPFDNLVPDERMLPAESLRFFYLDDNWFAAAADGALSLGLDSSRHLYLNKLVKSLLLSKARQVASQDRLVELARKMGAAPPAPLSLPALPQGMSGFLLRSDLVVGWPNLVVQPNAPVRILRIDHLAPDVLLCLFDGVPTTLTLSEPAEGLRFGVDDNGHVALRNPEATAAGKALKAGEQLPGAPTVEVWRNKGDGLGPGMREPASPLPSSSARPLPTPPASPLPSSSASRVLDINKLVQILGAGFAPARPNLSPAALALQLVKAPEALDLVPPPAAAAPAGAPAGGSPR